MIRLGVAHLCPLAKQYIGYAGDVGMLKSSLTSCCYCGRRVHECMDNNRKQLHGLLAVRPADGGGYDFASIASCNVRRLVLGQDELRVILGG